MSGRTRSPRLRQLAIFIVFVVGALASIATSAPLVQVDIPAQDATLHLDAQHPTALSRFVVALNAEASAQYGTEGGRLRVTDVRAPDGLSVPGGGAARLHLIVASVRPGAQASAGPEAPGQQPAPSPFEAEVRPLLETALPLACGIGPCERAFWLIAELTEPEAGALDIDWEVSARIQYSSDTWPSGAGGSIAIDPPTLLAGPPPSLVASTEPEIVHLGPRQPAAARVVEVTVGGAAIEADAAVAVLSVSMSPSAGSGGNYGRPPIVSVYPLEGIEGAGADAEAPLPTGLDPNPDPFAGCAANEDCRRQFLVTMEWTGETNADEAYGFSATVRRVDLLRAWSAPADLAASVIRRFDIAPAAASDQKLHLEGQSLATGQRREDQVQLLLGATTTATDPIARLLPLPAVMTYRSRTLVGDAAATPEPLVAYIGISFPGSGMRSINQSLGPREIQVVTNPLAGCRVGGSCGGLGVGTTARLSGPNTSVPDVPFQWSVDVTLYSFEEAPLTLFSTDLSPASH